MIRKWKRWAALLVLMGGVAAADAQVAGMPPQVQPPVPGLWAANGGPGGMGGAPGGGMTGMEGYGTQPLPGEAYPGQAQGGMPGQWPGGPLPPDPLQPQRFQMPTGALNHDYAGGNMTNASTRPDAATLGIRLDTGFKFGRETEFSTYLSEHQSVAAGGVTVLPYQSPCWIVGIRALAVYSGNNSMADDTVGGSFDVFAGTRYKDTYLKVGYITDFFSKQHSHGVGYGVLTNLPGLGNVTLDGTLRWGAGKDQFLEPLNVLNQTRRVGVYESDYQVRVGKFLSAYFQTGVVGNWTRFRETRQESNYGVFASWYVGGMTINGEVAGGIGGLRGIFSLGYSWGGGAGIDRHPIDTRYDPPVDTVSWVTKAVRRDITLKLRETPNGPAPTPGVLVLP